MRATVVVVTLAAALAAACGKKTEGSTAPGPGTGDASSIANGAQLYAKYCALCHGDKGDGYKADNAPSLVNPTFLASANDDFLRAGIERGRPGTAMAGFGMKVGGPMSDAEIGDVMAFLRKDAPPRAVLQIPQTGDAGRGKDLYMSKCGSCHGTPERRADFVMLGNASFQAAATDGFLRYAIVNGRPGTKMDPWGSKLDEQQIADVIAFVRSWPRASVPDPNKVVLPKVPVVINPSGPAPSFTLKEGRFVPAADVKKALDAGARIVIADARPPSDWLHGHIPGAISTPFYELSSVEQIPNDDTWVITYCACPHHASGIVLDELRTRGYKHTAVLDEGILGWQRAGFPAVDVDGKAAPQPPALPPPPAPPTHP